MSSRITFHTFEPHEAEIIAKTYQSGLFIYITGGQLFHICQPRHFSGATYTFDLSFIDKSEKIVAMITKHIKQGLVHQTSKLAILGVEYSPKGEMDWCTFMGETPDRLIEEWKLEAIEK